MNIFKLRSIVQDTMTGLTGMLTHYQVEMNGNAYYRFQPRGLNPETGQPVDGMWIVGSRIKGNETVNVDLPDAVLGTEVEDIGSGFVGNAVAINLHTTGCVHVQVQPIGTLKKTGGPIGICDFDIRRLKGKAIPVMTEKQIEADIKTKPSPAGCSPAGPSGR